MAGGKGPQTGLDISADLLSTLDAHEIVYPLIQFIRGTADAKN